MGPDGTAHAVWLEGFSEGVPETQKQKIGYAFKPPSGTWSTMADLSGPFPPPSHPLASPTPMIASDSQGGVHVVWSDGEGIWYTVKRGGESWSSPVEIFPTGDMPTLAIGPDDQIHLVWREGSSGAMLYSHRSPDGPWSPPMNLMERPGARYGPRLAVDPQGRVHLVWIDSTFDRVSVAYTQRSPDGDWSPVIPISGDDRSPTTAYLAAGTDGRIHVAWTNFLPSRFEVHYRARSPEGLWSAPVRLSHEQQSADGPGLWAQAGGLVHAVWFEGPVNHTDIMYTQVNLTRATEATLSQTVTLPSNLHRPTLSFAYMLDVPMRTGASLDAEVNGTPVFSTTVPTTGWTHGWADLSAWDGQRVTLSFHTGGPSTGVVHLDSVSLGSWLTPVVHSVSPAHVETWPGSVTITGENFIETPTVRLNETVLQDVQWVNERTLQVTLPADLTPGIYDVWVTNPAGQESALPRGLRIGKQVYLPAVFRQYAP